MPEYAMKAVFNFGKRACGCHTGFQQQVNPSIPVLTGREER
jgi:hypothetical protein